MYTCCTSCVPEGALSITMVSFLWQQILRSCRIMLRAGVAQASETEFHWQRFVERSLNIRSHVAHFAAASSTGTYVNFCTTDDFTKSADALVYYVDLEVWK